MLVSQIHFRQAHFLCEDDDCLDKKFIVFATEAEIKVSCVIFFLLFFCSFTIFVIFRCFFTGTLAIIHQLCLMLRMDCVTRVFTTQNTKLEIIYLLDPLCCIVACFGMIFSLFLEVFLGFKFSSFTVGHCFILASFQSHAALEHGDNRACSKRYAALQVCNRHFSPSKYLFLSCLLAL